MSSIDELKADIKKLSVKAANAKMNLHDLSEELPIGWADILSLAQETHDVYAALAAARKKLAELQAA